MAFFSFLGRSILQFCLLSTTSPWRFIYIYFPRSLMSIFSPSITNVADKNLIYRWGVIWFVVWFIYFWNFWKVVRSKLFNHKILFYFRYIDAYLLVCLQNIDLNDHANNIEPTINFTSDYESNKNLPFLHSMPHRNNTEVNRGTTNNNDLNNFNSHQSNGIKSEIIIWFI